MGTSPTHLWQRCKQDLRYSILPRFRVGMEGVGACWGAPQRLGAHECLAAPPSSFLLSLSSTCTSGCHFLLTQSLGPSSLQLPLSWNRPRPTSYSSPLSQLRHTSVCTLPPTRKVAKTRRMRGAAKRKLKATPLEVRDIVEGMWKLTALNHPCPHSHPGASINHEACLLGKGEPSTPGNSLASSPIHPILLLGFTAIVA